jgi:hypothetical protein
MELWFIGFFFWTKDIPIPAHSWETASFIFGTFYMTWVMGYGLRGQKLACIAWSRVVEG